MTKDENWQPSDGRAGTQEEYKDKDDRVLVKRTFNRLRDGSLQMLSTYYIYDDLGNLCYVFPPGGNYPDASTSSSAPSQSVLDQNVYQYRYDERNRLVEKRVPGKGWEYMVYNDLNLLVATQDSVLSAQNLWNYTKYDAFGRLVVTGYWSSSVKRAALQQTLNTQTVLWDTKDPVGVKYNNAAWPQGVTDFNVVNYYDDYRANAFPSGFGFSSYNGINTESIHTRGLLTASLTRSFASSSNLWKVNYYDDEGRVIQMQKGNHIGGKDVYNYQYSFTDQVLVSERAHTSATASVTVRNTYSYDHAGRKIDTRQKTGAPASIAAMPETLISHNEYNELGQLVDKKLHLKAGQSKYLQSVDYRYHIRGWLASINDSSLAVRSNNVDSVASSDADKFGMALLYETASAPQYNGNIGSFIWKNGQVSGVMSTAPSQFRYNFVYDKLNRLTDAVSSYGTSKKLFDEFANYDRKGNITSLGRYAPDANGSRAQVDSLIYTYSADQLTRVDDTAAIASRSVGFNEMSRSAGEIGYDVNGRMIRDLNKGITNVHYNPIGLPDVFTINGKTIEYEYDKTGNKLRKRYTNGTSVSITDYVDGIEYTTAPGGTPQLSFIQTEEGRARPNGSSYVYEYDLKDHLGNTRVTVMPDASDPTEGTARIVQESNYYPFGMEIIDPKKRFTLDGANNYLYNGKELQDEEGLNLYDYGARFYDPVIARWNVVDPLAEMFEDLSPYNYALNNPIRFIDPDGMTASDTTKNGGTLQEVTVTATRINKANSIVIPVPSPSLPALRPIPPPNPVLIFLALFLLPQNYFDHHRSEQDKLEEWRLKCQLNANKTVGELKDKYKYRGKTGGKGGEGTDIYDAEGGMKQADADFDDLVEPGTARPIPGGRMGKTPDGKTINVRDHSSEGQPTVEIYNPGNRHKETKFRYTP